MARKKNGQPLAAVSAAAVVILLLLSATSSTGPVGGVAAFLPERHTSRHLPLVGQHLYDRSNSRSTCSSLMSVAATPLSTSVNVPDSSSSDDDNSEAAPPVAPSKYKSLHEANMALDVLANQCSNLEEPVITRADECQSQWEEMRGTAMEPDTVSFNTVLKAWTRCCQSLANYKKQTNAFNSNNSGETTMSPTTTTINSDHPQVYTSKDAAERATLLLLSQEQDFETGAIKKAARPDTLSYNEAIAAWAKSGVTEAPQNAERLLKRMMDHDYIEPDGISYCGVVDAWAYSGKPESLQKVKQIWQHMEQLFAENDRIKPTIRTVNSIIQAHSRRVQELFDQRDADGARKTATEAEDFLDFMKQRFEQTNDPDHQPDVMTYTSVMDAYGRCGRYQSTLRAKALLEELKHVYEQTKNPRLKPNYRTYTCLITAWSKTRSPDSTQEADRLLGEMIKSEDPDMQPNARTFTSAIHAWGRSNDATKPQRALKILQTMKVLHKKGNKDARPSLITYNAAIDACARCQGDLSQQTDALKIAFAVLKAIQVEPALEANAGTYSTLLRACSFLLTPGEERNKVGTAVFEKARKGGMVDFRVLFNLKKVVESNVLQTLLDGVPQDRQGTFDFNSIPPGWARNVR